MVGIFAAAKAKLSYAGDFVYCYASKANASAEVMAAARTAGFSHTLCMSPSCAEHGTISTRRSSRNIGCVRPLCAQPLPGTGNTSHCQNLYYPLQIILPLTGNSNSLPSAAALSHSVTSTQLL